jgi:cell division protein FtsN
MRSTPALAPAGNAPLSLSPDANNAPPPVAQDNVPPPPPPRASAPPPARVASAPPPAASAGGSYLVQVSSQRSEAEAESAYRGIQSKFGSVLGSQPHTVRRADLGAKGVYYRAMVGPFASREEAVQVCSSLKQAGGECVVQH